MIVICMLISKLILNPNPHSNSQQPLEHLASAKSPQDYFAMVGNHLEDPGNHPDDPSNYIVTKKLKSLKTV